jgi:hypothetical protein
MDSKILELSKVNVAEVIELLPKSRGDLPTEDACPPPPTPEVEAGG